MKIRYGFVSNSSSSSFTAIVDEKIFEEALNQIKDERYQKILRGVCSEKNLFGRKLVVVQEMSDSGGNSSLFGEGSDFDYESMGLTDEDMERPASVDDDEFCPAEALYKYQEILEKLAKNKDKKKEILILDDMGIG